MEQVVACALFTQRARVRSPVGTGFLGEVFSGFSSPVRQMSGSFRPPRSPNIIWPSSSSFHIYQQMKEVWSLWQMLFKKIVVQHVKNFLEPREQKLQENAQEPTSVARGWATHSPLQSSTAVKQAVARAPVTQRAGVRSPVGTSFLGEVFSGFFLTCKTNVRKL